MSGLTVKSSFGRQDKDSEKVKPFFVTGTKVGSNKVAVDTMPWGYYEVSTSNTAGGSSTDKLINLTSHGAKVGDAILFTSGSLEERIVMVEEIVDANNFKLSHICSASTAGLTFNIYRQTFQRFSSTGEQLVSLSSSPLQFTKNGSTVNVNEDTVTPSNNIPLPVKLMGVNGTLSVTSDVLDVQSSHTGAGFDSMRIGDGTELLAINANNEALVRDADTITALGSLLTELQLKADLSETQPVSLASVPLPTGAATETKQDSQITLLGTIDTDTGNIATDTAVINTKITSLEAKDFATQSTLSSLNNKFNSLGQKASAASVPVVISSDQSAIPASQSGTWNINNISGTISLPTGAATETTLSAMSAKLPAALGIQTAANSLSITPASNAVFTMALPAQTGEFAEKTSLTTVQTFTAPTGAFAALIQTPDTNTTNVRFKQGATATTTSGLQLQPGRSEYLEAGTDISVVSESGTTAVSVIWFKR